MSFIWIYCSTGRSQFVKQTCQRTKVRQSSFMPPWFPFHLSPPPPPPSSSTFICCPINNCYCSFNYTPVISKSGEHVSSSSQGILGNYQHPSKSRCSRSSVTVVITRLPRQTSVPWARSPRGLSLSRHGFLHQPWHLAPTMAQHG